MDKQYSTMHQYEPLRTPPGWNEEERWLILQLTQLFDDLYRRFNRIRYEDLGSTLQRRIAEGEARIAALEEKLKSS